MAQHRGHAARAHPAGWGEVVRVGVEVAAQQDPVRPGSGAGLERGEQLRDLHGAQLLDLLREIRSRCVEQTIYVCLVACARSRSGSRSVRIRVRARVGVRVRV